MKKKFRLTISILLFSLLSFYLCAQEEPLTKFETTTSLERNIEIAKERIDLTEQQSLRTLKTIKSMYAWIIMTLLGVVALFALISWWINRREVKNKKRIE
jgi:hypothetical protein